MKCRCWVKGFGLIRCFGNNCGLNDCPGYERAHCIVITDVNIMNQRYCYFDTKYSLPTSIVQNTSFK